MSDDEVTRICAALEALRADMAELRAFLLRPQARKAERAVGRQRNAEFRARQAEKIKTLRLMWRAGKRLTDIARALGWSPSYVSKRARMLDLPIRPPGGWNMWSNADKERMRQLLAAGLSHRRIAARLGRTHSAVQAAAVRFGMSDKRQPHRPIEPERPAVADTPVSFLA